MRRVPGSAQDPDHDEVQKKTVVPVTGRTWGLQACNPHVPPVKLAAPSSPQSPAHSDEPVWVGMGGGALPGVISDTDGRSASPLSPASTVEFPARPPVRPHYRRQAAGISPC